MDRLNVTNEARYGMAVRRLCWALRTGSLVPGVFKGARKYTAEGAELEDHGKIQHVR